MKMLAFIKTGVVETIDLPNSIKEKNIQVAAVDS